MATPVQGHDIPDKIDAAVTVTVNRQSRHHYNGMRLFAPATVGFLLYGFLGHVLWSQIVGYCSAGAAVWNLVLFAWVVTSEEYRSQVKRDLLAQAVVRRAGRS